MQQRDKGERLSDLIGRFFADKRNARSPSPATPKFAAGYAQVREAARKRRL